jgi:ubiquinone/menaquinone biosynthesis C-methylase UbiE
MAGGQDDRRQTPRHGPSSFGMQAPEAVFGPLGLRPGDVFLDLGCGPGDYALAAARIVGPRGRVYGLDQWDEVLKSLRSEAMLLGISNLLPIAGDFREGLPLADGWVDVCLMATLWHVLNLKRDAGRIFGEVRRVMKIDGRLAVLSFKKEDRPRGPPLAQRPSPDQIAAAVAPHGFRQNRLADLGDNFLLVFGCE